jgi:hypothetical protein
LKLQIFLPSIHIKILLITLQLKGIKGVYYKNKTTVAYFSYYIRKARHFTAAGINIIHAVVISVNIIAVVEWHSSITGGTPADKENVFLL